MKIKIDSTYRYDPNKQISASYLGSTKNEECEPVIHLTRNNLVQVCLPTHEKLLMLADTGATKSLISISSIEKSSYLSSLKRFDIENIDFKVGNGDKMTARFGIKLNFNVQGHDFEVTALAVPNLGGIDMILGNKSMRELECQIDLTTNKIKFKAKSLGLKAAHNVSLRPGESRSIKLYGRLPNILNNKDVTIVVNKHLRSLAGNHILVTIHRSSAVIRLYNASSKTQRIRAQTCAAYVDISSLTDIYHSIHAYDNSSTETVLHCTETTTSNSPTNSRPSSPNPSASSTISTSTTSQSVREINKQRYPFLDDDDPKLNMTETEVITQELDLKTNCILDETEKEDFKQLLNNNRKAFSLYGEIGECPNIEVDFKLRDDSPFFIRPYSVSSNEKIIIDKELRRLELLGVLKKGYSDYTSPVMLVKRKGPCSRPRVISDLRKLNNAVSKQNKSFILVREVMQMLGESESTVMSTIDLKDAFYSLRLSPRSSNYCSISPYHGGQGYKYTRLPMGLTLSPCIFQSTMDDILAEIPNYRSFVKCQMDDLLVHSKDKETHKKHIKILLETLAKHGLKISLKKCSFFRIDLNYLGHRVLIKDNRPCITAQKDKTSAIRGLKSPVNKRSLKRFIGMVSYLSMYLPKLQELLQPMHKLTGTRKGRPKTTDKFIWTPECEDNFQKIKQLLTSPPVLTMPRTYGDLHVYSDSSSHCVGASVFQVQDGIERLIAYHSKVMPPSFQRYTISEKELTALWSAISHFKYLLKGSHFYCFVDHSSLVQILKSKSEIPTLRLQKLYEKLSDYSFDLSYRKGKDLVIADCLSRSPVDDQDDEIPEATPISFNMFDTTAAEDVLKAVKDDNGDKIEHYAYPAGDGRPVTRSFAKKQNLSIPTLWPQGRKAGTANTTARATPRRAVQVRPAPQVLPAAIPVNAANVPAPHIPVQQPANIPNVPYIAPQEVVFRPAPPPDYRQSLVDPDLTPQVPPVEAQIPRTDSQEVVETHTLPDESMYTPLKPLFTKSISQNSILRRHIPRQTEIDKLLQVIKKRVLTGYNLPFNAREVKLHQQKDPHFKDIYAYVSSGILPPNKVAAKRILNLAESYILVEGLLFRLYIDKKNEDCKITLAIPNSMVPRIFDIMHDGICGQHQGITRTYLTIRKQFYIVNLFDKLRKWIMSCEVCQKMKSRVESSYPREYCPRIPDSYVPMSRISGDIKVMPESYRGNRFILFLTCEITRFCIGIPLKSKDAPSLAEAILQRVVFLFGKPETLILDEESSLSSKVFDYLVQTLKIDRKFISPSNHGSLHVERHIQTLSNFICSNLNFSGKNWDLYVSAACHSYNTFVSPKLGYSPFYLTFLRNPPDMTGLHYTPIKTIATGYREYVQLLKDRLEHVGKTMLDLQAATQHLQAATHAAKLRKPSPWKPGMLVYLLAPSASSLQTNTLKVRMDWVGPLSIYSLLDNNHCILQTLDGCVIVGSFHTNRLKIAWVRTKNGPTNSFEQLRRKFHETRPSTGHKESEKVMILNDQNEEYYNLSNESVLFLGQTSQIDLKEYIHHSNQYGGLATKCPLDEKEMKKLVMRMDILPFESTDYNLVKGRFKAGHLEVLVQNPIHKQETLWINLLLHPCAYKVAENVISSKLRVTGSPGKLMSMLM